MLRVVPDPGVLLAALISPTGAPSQLVRRWLGGEIQFVCSPSLLHEFGQVGERDRFRRWFDTDELRTVARLLVDAGEWIEDVELDGLPPADPKDAYLVALTAAAAADCLVTGDGVLRRHDGGVRIITPRELINVLDDLSNLVDPRSG